eukprot:3581036-Pyramimonas_sp.AAC.1
MLFDFSPFRFRWPPEASRWLQDDPGCPKTAGPSQQIKLVRGSVNEVCAELEPRDPKMRMFRG